MRISALLLFAAVLAPPSSAPAIEWACSEAGLPAASCGLATCDDHDLTSGDALVVLRSAVASEYCSPCRCDADGSGIVAATDALRILRSSVGGQSPLSCPSCNTLEITAGELDESGVGAHEVVASGDGGLVVGSLEETSIVVRRFDADLAPVGEAREVVELARAPLGIVLCARPDGSVAVAWDERVEMNFPAPHDYDDTSNVRAALLDADGQSSGSIDVHAPTKGGQYVRGLFCRPMGGFAVYWLSMSIGLRDLGAGVTSYTVSGGPLNGVHVSRLDAAGSPLGPSSLLIRNYSWWSTPWTRAVEVSEDEATFSSLGRVVLAKDSGSVIADQSVLGDGFYGVLRTDCMTHANRCASVANQSDANVLVYDPAFPASPLGITLKPSEQTYEPPDWFVTAPEGAQLACDETGICIGFWSLVRRKDVDHPEEYDDPQFLGTFGRAFNALTGDMGPEVPLASNKIVAIGPGRFVSLEDGAGDTTAFRLMHVQ